ncbi:MAG: hypothetical protein ACHQJ4_07150, partial [Ignavibacteria bacterium]
MTFKKDYINYLLYKVMIGNNEFRHNERIKGIVEKIRATDDVIRITYLIGKTAGLELLFKYLLYISDKIDKSQITVFSLKDNFDHDVYNLTKVFTKIVEYKSDGAAKKIESIEIPKDKENSKDRIKIDTTGSEERRDSEEIPEEEIIEDENAPSLTLIENSGDGKTEAEVFELSEINEDIETTVNENRTDENDISTEEEDVPVETEDSSEVEEAFRLENLEDEVEDDKKTEEVSQTGGIEEEIRTVEIEVRKPLRDYEETGEIVKEEAVTNEAYYTFESKFFEEVKILEKLFRTVEKDCKSAESGKLSEKCLQSLTVIMEITSELSNLSRQLSFDLIADIFLTMNLYFTKAISSPEIITEERIKLLTSSLALVNSLIKGEDYLNYDVIVDKIEILKNDVQRPVEEVIEKEETSEGRESIPEHVAKQPVERAPDEETEQVEETPEERPEPEAEYGAKHPDMESVNFKLRYLIKEFEKSFNSIGAIKGEYKRFDALDKIDELNHALRLIAKISAAVKMKDVLKLAEVSY